MQSDLWCVDNLTSLIKNKWHPGVGGGRYSWGKAELTGKWVILHKGGETTWAIFFKKKKPSVAIPFHPNDEFFNPRPDSDLIPSDNLPKKFESTHISIPKGRN